MRPNHCPSLSVPGLPAPPSPTDLCVTKDIENHPASQVTPFLFLGNMKDASDAAGSSDAASAPAYLGADGALLPATIAHAELSSRVLAAIRDRGTNQTQLCAALSLARRLLRFLRSQRSLQLLRLRGLRLRRKSLWFFTQRRRGAHVPGRQALGRRRGRRAGRALLLGDEKTGVTKLRDGDTSD